MLGNIYFTSWILLAAAAMAWVVSGNMNPIAALVFSSIVFAVFYAFALWLTFFGFGAVDDQPKHQMRTSEYL